MRNVRVAARSFRHSPGFALTATLTLALGIGLSTAVFTVADALLLRRLPVLDQDRLVVLWAANKGFDHFPLKLASGRELARRARSLRDAAFVAYEGAWPVPIRDGDRISRLRRALVSGDFFGVLGVQPVLGRTLRPTDDVVGAAPVLVVSYATWQQRFGGDPRVLDRRIAMYDNGVAYSIVGVMPPGLEYPRGADFWAPLIPARTTTDTNTTVLDVELVARLAPGATDAAAVGELDVFFGRPGASPFEHELRGVVHTLPRLILGETRPALFAFAAAAGLLLLITCINVANLLVVRGLSRVREIAVRAAVGADRRQIIGQLLVENLVLAIVGGALGLLVAALAVRSFVAMAPAGVPRLDEIGVNAAALAGAAGITGVAMLLFGLAPAIMTSHSPLQQVLRSGARQSASRGVRLATEALVAGQVALALLVLSASGLIARSLIKLERAELSLEPSRLLIGELSVRYDRFDTADKQRALIDRLLPVLAATPGVRAVSPVVAVPFSGSGGWDGRPTVEGQTAEQASGNPMLNMDVVTPDYWTTLGIPVLRGRAFTEADREGAPAVVMLSESAARHFWPGANPIGKRLGSAVNGPWLTVIGIVPDTRYRDLRDARASIYYPLRQSPFPFAPMTLAIRTTGSPAAMVPAIRNAIGAVDPGVALASASPFDTFLDRPLAQPRLNAALLAVFAFAALALAAVGLFGVTATMVRQRTRELGVRMALGATATDLWRMVMRRGLLIASAGSAAGLLGAVLANRLLVSMLYEVSPTDGVTLGAVAAVLLIVATCASVIPARSSTRIDPVIALRSEG